MALSLYDATVPQFLQILPATVGLIDKAEAWCKDKGVDPAEIIGASVAPDMFPLSWQARYAAIHSADAVKAVFDGLFRVDKSPPPETFAEMRARLADAISYLQGVDPAGLTARSDADLAFEYDGNVIMRFTGADYLLSFALPNFYFHSTTLYAILRAKGLEVGKRDFIGTPRIKQPA